MNPETRQLRADNLASLRMHGIGWRRPRRRFWWSLRAWWRNHLAHLRSIERVGKF